MEPCLAPQGVFPPPLTSTVPSLPLTALAFFYRPSLRCLTPGPNPVYSVSYHPWLATNREYAMCFHTNFTRVHKNPVWLLGSLSFTTVDLQKWGLCYSQSTGPCQIQNVSRHATTAKGFMFCRCAELRPAPSTRTNLLFAATTTCSFPTVRSRLYQRQHISASSCFHTILTRLHKNLFGCLDLFRARQWTFRNGVSAAPSPQAHAKSRPRDHVPQARRLLAGVPVASSLRRSPRCLCLGVS